MREIKARSPRPPNSARLFTRRGALQNMSLNALQVSVQVKECHTKYLEECSTEYELECTTGECTGRSVSPNTLRSARLFTRRGALQSMS